MRIYFVGSHATGKTTMARYVSKRYGLPMITEVARSVLAELEANLEHLRTDIDAVNQYQRQVLERQMEVEHEQTGAFVSDRSFDNLAYTAEHATMLSAFMETSQFKSYVEWVKQGTTFYLRPHPSLLKEDGVRASVDWESVVRIDGMVKFMLEQYQIRYLPIDTPSMQERIRTVEFVLGDPLGVKTS